MKLNFKRFKLPQGVSHNNFVEIDIREALGNIVYTCGEGVFALSLAMKIFQSEGEIEISDKESCYLQKMSEIGGRPPLIDGIRLAVEQAKGQGTDK